MKAILFIAAIIPCAALSVSAAILAFHGIAGWGWFLFAAWCISPSMKWGDNKEDNPREY